jgi:hypothetical protein
VWQLELLLFFKNGRKTSVADLTKSLYMETKVVEAGLSSFCSHGILRKDDKQGLFTASAVSKSLIDELSRAHDERRHYLISFIYASPKPSRLPIEED